MKIGKITINSKLALAPMAGVTDLGFRTVCRELGAGYTVTEMVSAKALCYQDKKSIPLLKLGEGEHPSAAQIFGSDPACMEEAAAIADYLAQAGITQEEAAARLGVATGTVKSRVNRAREKISKICSSGAEPFDASRVQHSEGRAIK